MAVHKIEIDQFDPVAPFSGQSLPALDFIPIDRLIIDDRYQRTVERRGKQNILKIANNFDWSKFSPVVLSRRDDGTFAIIDGQHRTHAAALVGIEKVPAIITDMTIEQEASAFSWVNGSVTALTPNQIFKAALAAFEPWAVMSDAAVSKADCRLMPYNKSTAHKKPGEIFSIGLIRKFVDAGAAAQVTTTLLGIKGSKACEDLTHYSASSLAALIPATINTGITRPDAISDFLNRNDLRKVTKMVDKVIDLPENRGRSHASLFADSVRVLLKNHMAEAA